MDSMNQIVLKFPEVGESREYQTVNIGTYQPNLFGKNRR